MFGHMDAGLADVGLAYHELQRRGRGGAWSRVFGVVLALGLTFAVAPLMVQIVIAAWAHVVGQPAAATVERVLDLRDPSPLSLALLNVVLAAAIPATFVVNRMVHGLDPGWLSSVVGRIRWGYLVVCIGLSAVVLALTVAVGALVPQDASVVPMGTEVNEFTRTTRDFLLVIALLTPLQAAGEEYLFRGYLTQAVGGLARRPVVSRMLAVGVPAVLFAFAHGAGQTWPVFVDRLAFGLVSGVLVIATGGLEAAIAMHVLNNFVAYGLALAFTDMASALNPTAASWWSLPATLTQSLVYLALAVAAARYRKIATRTGVSELSRE